MYAYSRRTKRQFIAITLVLILTISAPIQAYSLPVIALAPELVAAGTAVLPVAAKALALTGCLVGSQYAYKYIDNLRVKTWLKNLTASTALILTTAYLRANNGRISFTGAELNQINAELAGQMTASMSMRQDGAPSNAIIAMESAGSQYGITDDTPLRNIKDALGNPVSYYLWKSEPFTVYDSFNRPYQAQKLTMTLTNYLGQSITVKQTNIYCLQGNGEAYISRYNGHTDNYTSSNTFWLTGNSQPATMEAWKGYWYKYTTLNNSGFWGRTLTDAELATMSLVMTTFCGTRYWEPPLAKANPTIKAVSADLAVSLPLAGEHAGSLDSPVEDNGKVEVPYWGGVSWDNLHADQPAQDVINDLANSQVASPVTINQGDTTNNFTLDLNVPSTFTIDWSPLLVASELKTVFPFSIPWDFWNLFKVFLADPVTPHFTLNFQVPFLGVTYPIDVDFSPFDTIAAICRWFVLLFFSYGLITKTKSLIWG